MLVLTRKAQETIKIGNDIVITVIKTKGKAVRLGVQAPADVPVLRGELAAAIDRDQTQPPAVESVEIDPDADTAGESGEVRYARVSRSKVGTVLPELLGDAGPLREILMQRSGVAG
ncbi:MAG: carbon storage regulator [Planctomycetota bacterium]